MASFSSPSVSLLLRLSSPAEAASAWTLVYPQFSVVIPSPGGVSIPIVYALPTGDDTFGRFVDAWIEIAMPLGVTLPAYTYSFSSKLRTNDRQKRS